MTIYFDVFCPLMKNRILGVVKGQLSQYNGTGVLRNSPKDAIKDLKQTNSLVVAAIDRYSTSVEDLEAVVCFLVHHETRDPPRFTR